MARREDLGVPKPREESLGKKIMKLVAGALLALILGAVLGRLLFWYTVEAPTGESFFAPQEAPGVSSDTDEIP